MKGRGKAVLVARPFTSLPLVFAPPLLFKRALTQLAPAHCDTSMTQQHSFEIVCYSLHDPHTAQSQRPARVSGSLRPHSRVGG